MSRVVEDPIGRLSGPMKFRLLLQPFMAAIFAIRSGLKDARDNKPPHFWAMFADPRSRADMLRDGWKSVGGVFIMAVVLDAIYQFIVFRWLYPVEAMLVAVVRALVPYLLIRGPVSRIARRRKIWRQVPDGRQQEAVVGQGSRDRRRVAGKECLVADDGAML